MTTIFTPLSRNVHPFFTQCRLVREVLESKELLNKRDIDDLEILRLQLVALNHGKGFEISLPKGELSDVDIGIYRLLFLAELDIWLA